MAFVGAAYQASRSSMQKQPSTFYRVTSQQFGRKPFVAGLTIRNDRVVYEQTAPILAFMLGYSFERVDEYCKHNGWKLEQITEFTDADHVPHS